MSRFIVAIMVLAGLAGCATVKPYDIGGSKADGTVIMGGILREFDSMDWSEAEEIAVARCKGWGYARAEGFSGTRSQCVSGGGAFGCGRMEVTRTYQCLDE